MKLLVIGSLRSGAVVHTVRGNYFQNEMRLFHAARPTLAPNEIVIYDRAAGHFVGAVQVRAQGADLISRMAVRHIDWRKGRCLGRGDRLVEWRKGLQKPKYLSKAEWAQLPEKITVRVVRVRVSQNGFRTRELTPNHRLVCSDRMARGSPTGTPPESSINFSDYTGSKIRCPIRKIDFPRNIGSVH